MSLESTFLITKEFFTTGLAFIRMPSALTTKMPSTDGLKMSKKKC